MDGTMNVAAKEIPSFLINYAVERNSEKNLLIKTAGGIGDYICAEPAIRYAVKHFTHSTVSLASDRPEIFRHLKFNKVFNLKTEQPVYEDFLNFNILEHHESLKSEFICHLFTHCVDYVCINMFRAQIPIFERQLVLRPSISDVFYTESLIDKNRDVIVHAGRGWQSKTFPKEWWDEVLGWIIKAGHRPVLIGADPYVDRGTVDTITQGCLDLRNKLSLMQSIALLQHSKALLTNDSAPMHMAASGNAWVGVVSTVRHPDHIFHYRDGGKIGWRMKNLSLGGAWEGMNICPNNREGIRIDVVDQNDLLRWLPSPNSFADWGVQKLHLT